MPQSQTPEITVQTYDDAATEQIAIPTPTSVWDPVLYAMAACSAILQELPIPADRALAVGYLSRKFAP